MSKSQPAVDAAFELLTDAAAHEGDDIDERVADHQARNFFTHVGSLSLTKLADGLIDPKLVLSSLLTALGAPVMLVGLLVPVREAGALLPQLPLAYWTRDQQVRKWLWVAGSVVQGLAALVIAMAAFVFDGLVAGLVIVCALGILAIARSACSLSYKDVLGKTVAKHARGTVTGLAASTASVGVFAFGLLLVMAPGTRADGLPFAILLAAGFWLVAATAMATLYERPAPVDGGKGAGLREATLSLWREDAQLRRFIITRGLLVSTALAPPYMVALAGAGDEGNGTLRTLGLLVLASAGASFLSSYVWGRLSDRSSRLVLMMAGGLGSVSLAATIGLDLAGQLDRAVALPVMLFVLMIAYHGVRVGRSTHLVDMAPTGRRAAYTALSNTLIGGLVLAGGVISGLAAIAGPAAALGVFALASAAAIVSAAGLKDVQSGQ